MLDPPSLPQKPSFPNRLVFAFGGFAGGLGLGVAIVALLEVQDTALRTERDVEAVLKLPTLALIPVIATTRASEGPRRIGIRPPSEPVSSIVGI
jgi:capsular polysaccharide biosynthesis protein